jgi:uncharacterized protein
MHPIREMNVRERWKRAGLIFLSLLALVIAFVACAVAVRLIGIHSIVIAYVALATVCSLAYLASVRWVERRPVAEFSLPPALPELAGGMMVGLALFAIVIGVLWAVGVYQPQGWGSFGGIGLGFVFWLAIGVLEEIEFRGLVYRLCGAVLGTWGAIVVSGLAFGLVHGMDPGATATALASVALAGLLLGAAFALTGRLWLPIGIHAGWNFAEGSLFGTAVSGHDLGASLIKARVAGPELLAGGRFGPEASIVTVIVLLAATGFLVRRIAALRRVEPPIWRAGKAAPAVFRA